MPVTLPYRFDTRGVWRTILTGAFVLNALLMFAAPYVLLVRQERASALGIVLIELVVAGFTLVFVRQQEGSAGLLSSDRIEVEPNVLFGISLPGPRGSYRLDQFVAVRVEFRSGPIRVDVGASGGPNEVVWLVGGTGTPDIALALTQREAGRAVGREFGAVLKLPVEETRSP